MFLSDISIKRPVLTVVLNSMIIIAGLACIFLMPVREYPDVENPVVSVSTAYVGASPETIESTVTEPLEEALSGITDIRTITSTSAYGISNINIEFETTRDIDTAATDVTNAVQSALGKIPQEAEKPTISRSGANSDAIMWIIIQGDKYSSEELTDFADRIVKPPLQILSGVSNVLIGGAHKYAIRIWLDPDKMAGRKIDYNDIRNAVLKNNILLPAGQIKGTTRQFIVHAQGLLENPEQFENIFITNENGIPVYLKDVGKVELGSENYDSVARFDGREVVGIGIVKQSKANELKVVERVKKELPRIIDALPEGVKLKVAVDRTKFIKESLKEVFITLWIAFGLVVIITLLFLRSFVATIIVSLSIPISIVGTFGFLYLLGYSINALTMLAMVLAIGLVVDDAIVVLENIFRRQESGEQKLTSAFKGSKEVAFPVIATTLCLIAVFIPLATLSGTTGRLFKEFSISIAIAVAISSFVALTVIPALCSRFLNYKSSHKTLSLEQFQKNITANYEKQIQNTIRQKHLIIGFLLINIIGSILIFKLIPKTFVPIEDRGGFVAIVKAPQGSTLAYTSHFQSFVEKEIKKIPEVIGFFSAVGLSIGGPGNPANGILFATLKHWKERKVKQQAIVQNLFPKLSKIPGILTFPINPPSLGQRTFGKDIEFVIKGASDFQDLISVRNKMIEKIKNIPGLINVDSDLLLNTPQLNININRDRATDLSLPASEILNAIQTSLAESKINDFILKNKQYDVITSLFPKEKSKPSDIRKIYIKNKHNEMIPLDSVIQVKTTVGPSQINHFDLQRSISISASLLPGFALGDSLNKIQKIAKDELKGKFSISLTGISREFAESSFSLYFAFIISIIFIYLTLAAVFESFVHPFTIILTVPLALFGALITVFTFGQSINIYSQIGTLLLVGIVTKNSILIVDYVNRHRAQGFELDESIIQACKIRLRPILMTAMTMILGTLPLVFASGAGAEGRFSMGLVITSGLSFATFFTLFVVPTVYKIIVETAEKFNIKTIQEEVKLVE